MLKANRLQLTVTYTQGIFYSGIVYRFIFVFRTKLRNIYLSYSFNLKTEHTTHLLGSHFKVLQDHSLIFLGWEGKTILDIQGFIVNTRFSVIQVRLLYSRGIHPNLTLVQCSQVSQVGYYLGSPLIQSIRVGTYITLFIFYHQSDNSLTFNLNGLNYNEQSSRLLYKILSDGMLSRVTNTINLLTVYHCLIFLGSGFN